MAFNPFGSDAVNKPSSNNPFQSPEQHPQAASGTAVNQRQLPSNGLQPSFQLAPNYGLQQQQYPPQQQPFPQHPQQQQPVQQVLQPQAGGFNSVQLPNGGFQQQQGFATNNPSNMFMNPQKQQVNQMQQSMAGMNFGNMPQQFGGNGVQTPAMRLSNGLQMQPQMNQQQPQQTPMFVSTTQPSQLSAMSFDPFSPTAQASPAPAQSPSAPTPTQPNVATPTQPNVATPTQPNVATFGEAWGIAPPSPTGPSRGLNALSPMAPRLLAQADALVNRSLITEQDKEVVHKILEQPDTGLHSRLEAALQRANEGNMTALSGMLYDARWTKSESASIATSATTVSMGAATGTAEASDDDSDGMSTISGDSDDGARSKEVSETFSLPHPYAGGFAGVIPSALRMEENDTCFVGPCLFRVSSKKVFRKWKPVFFSVQQNSLSIYESERHWQSQKTKPIKVISLTHMQRVGKPTEKKTHSVRDDGTRVFHTVLRANDLEAVEHNAVTGNRERPMKYDSVQPNFVVCKLGSTSQNQILALAYSIQSVISAKVKEHEKRVKGKHKSSGSTFQVTGRYS